MLQINSIILLITVFITLISFLWVRKIKDIKVALWYILLALFLFVYSGAGASIVGVNKNYIFYYTIYLATLSLTLYVNRHNNLKNDTHLMRDNNIISLVDKYGGYIIVLYYLTNLFDLIYPEYRLIRIIKPPTPSLEGLHYSRFIENQIVSPLNQFVYLLQQFLIPFFYLSLFKYRKSYLKILLLLLGIIYLDFCDRGIFGRGQIMVPFIIVFLSVYETLSATKRKVLVFSTIFIIPVFAYFFVQFSNIRIGGSMQDLSFFQALQIVFDQEIRYPLHFDSYINNTDIVSIWDYLLWILLLPFPGFLKFGFGDPQINLHFSTLVSGLTPYDRAFSISLPGIVGESIFVFGKYLYPLHAVLLGFIISKLIKYLSKYQAYRYILFYALVLFSYNVSRAGTTSVYSFVFKQFLILIIFIYFLRRRKIKHSRL